MHLPLVVLCVALPLAPLAAIAEPVTIEYVITSDRMVRDEASVAGTRTVTSTIDGASFRNVHSPHGLVERSDDDARTTRFDPANEPPQAPLDPAPGSWWEPLAGSIADETMVVGESTPGPALFGLPTREYTVDYGYTVVARIAYVVRRKTRNRARLTITVADNGVSSAAFRVALSRGYGYALGLRPDAFTGLPLRIEGTFEEGDPLIRLARVRVEAVSMH